GQRRTAIAAKGATGGIGGLKPFGCAAGPGRIVGGDQRAEESAKGLLTHAAMADRGPTQTGHPETDRTTLAASRMGINLLGHRLISHLVWRAPVSSLESIRVMPCSASSARMASALAKSLALRAAR